MSCFLCGFEETKGFIRISCVSRTVVETLYFCLSADEETEAQGGPGAHSKQFEEGEQNLSLPDCHFCACSTWTHHLCYLEHIQKVMLFGIICYSRHAAAQGSSLHSKNPSLVGRTSSARGCAAGTPSPSHHTMACEFTRLPLLAPLSPEQGVKVSVWLTDPFLSRNWSQI